MKKLKDSEKLKYWLDIEFTILHIMFGVIMLQLTTGWIPNLFFGVYTFWSFIYLISRTMVLAADDPEYLKVPKR